LDKDGGRVSATNRGSIREEYDFYPTPRSAVDPFLKEFILNPESLLGVLECCAGDGAIIKAIQDYCSNVIVEACEIQPRFESDLRKLTNAVYIEDFTKFDPDGYDLIISNPPFNQAEEIITHALENTGGFTEIAMLLRLGFLETKIRKPFWDKHPLTQLYVLSKRPSFIGRGRTDSSAYGWLVWSDLRKPLIKVI